MALRPTSNSIRVFLLCSTLVAVTLVLFGLRFDNISFFRPAPLAHADSETVPTISSVSGVVTNGESITINGSGFGATGPSVAIFDDFEKGANGEDIMTGPNSAQYGGWDDIGTISIPQYSEAQKVSGNLAFRADLSAHWREYVTKNIPSASKVFISYWTMIPSGDAWPGQGSVDQINWKVAWLHGSDIHDDDLTLPTYLGDTSQLTTGLIGGDCPYTKYVDGEITKGQWKRSWAYIVGGVNNDGIVQYWRLSPTAGVLQEANDVGVSNLCAEADHDGDHFFKGVDINGYGRSTANSHPMFDDVYIAYGDAARARIEIGNAMTYASSTNLAIFTPTAWSNTQITATVRPGSFTNGAAYLYVTDANGTVNATGYQITLGGTSHPPVLDAIGNKTTNENQLLSFVVSASDADGDTLTFPQPTGLPIGASFTDHHNNTATFSWVPSFTQAGSYPITFFVTDGAESDTELITITVTNVNHPPVFTPIGDKTIHEQDDFSFLVTATDVDAGDPLMLSASNLPSGAIFTDHHNGSGTFSWTPTEIQAQVYPNIHFSASDGAATDTDDITITVLDGAANCTPNWQCSVWSLCVHSLQSRSCSDINVCGIDVGRPGEILVCDSTPPDPVGNLVANKE